MFGTFKLGEGSEEARNKRAVRRYLNKKKEDRRHVDEEAVNEMEFRPGSMGHMMQAVHDKHEKNEESPYYHVHKVGHDVGDDSAGTLHHHYMLINKQSRPIGFDGKSHRHATHTFRLHRNEGGNIEIHHENQFH